MARKSIAAGPTGRTPDRPDAAWIWDAVLRHCPDCTGRAGGLRRPVAKAEAPVLPHALYELGGVGSTQLAVEFACRYADRNDLIWWVPTSRDQACPDAGQASKVELFARLAAFALLQRRGTSSSFAGAGHSAGKRGDPPPAPDRAVSRQHATRAPAVETYLSYKRRGQGEAVVNRLDTTLTRRGLTVRRDKREIPYRGSIEDFMRRLGGAEFVIIVVDDAYLRSRNCMFELTAIADRVNFTRRVFPIILEDADIFDVSGRLRYVKHWETRKAELETDMRDVPLDSLVGIREELDLYAKIGRTVGGITYALQNMNTLTVAEHLDDDFGTLIHSIHQEHARSAASR